MRRTVILILGSLLVFGLVYGAINETQAEGKVAGWIRSIYSTMESAGQSVTRDHNKTKNYVTSNPTHIGAGDKTKLNGLQTLINTYQTAKQAVLDYIDTEFEGINY